MKALLPNPDHRLRPGLFARAELGIARREDVVLIPEEAVLQRADGPVAFRAVDGATRVERRVLQIGRIKSGEVEVVSGLAPGDSVVIRGHAALPDGAAVSARNPDGSPAVAASHQGAAPPAEVKQ